MSQTLVATVAPERSSLHFEVAAPDPSAKRVLELANAKGKTQLEIPERHRFVIVAITRTGAGALKLTFSTGAVFRFGEPGMGELLPSSLPEGVGFAVDLTDAEPGDILTVVFHREVL